MEAIKKKMQAMKVEKDNAMDRADACEEGSKQAKVRAEKAEDEVSELLNKARQLETELDITSERLSIVTMQLEEKEKSLLAAEAEVNAAAALLDLFELDPTSVGRGSSTPMYGDWRPGRSGGLISYATLRRELVDDLTAVGEPELAGHTHSFRRGAASALGGIGAPDSATRMVGLWATDANLGYTWASTPIARQNMLEMAEWDGRVDTARLDGQCGCPQLVFAKKRLLHLSSYIHVKSVDACFRFVAGHIPPDIMKCTALRVLNLEDNQLAGP